MSEVKNGQTMKLQLQSLIRFSMNVLDPGAAERQVITKESYLQNDGADEFDTRDDGSLAPGDRHLSLCGIGEELSCYLDLSTCGLQDSRC